MSSSSSSSSISSDRQQAVVSSSPTALMLPLASGQLVARHVFRYTAERRLLNCCFGCRQEFQPGDVIMEDVYLREGGEDPSLGLEVGDKKQVFQPAVSIRLHASGACAKGVALAARQHALDLVKLPSKTPMGEVDKIHAFRWCQAWISWHEQFVFSSLGDTIQIAATVQRPQLMPSHGCRSFTLAMSKVSTTSPSRHIPVPKELVVRPAVLRSLLTRISVYHLSYTGDMQPIVLITNACSAVLRSHLPLSTQVFAHTVQSAEDEGDLNDTYHHPEGGESTGIRSRVRVVVRAHPTDKQLDQLVEHLTHDARNSHLTWHQLAQHCQAAPADHLGLLDHNRLFDENDSLIREALSEARMTPDPHSQVVSVYPASRIILSGAVTRYVSNSYPAAAVSTTPTTYTRYVFCDDTPAAAKQAPLLCFQGPLTQALPVSVSSNEDSYASQEMYENSGMRPVPTPQLRMVFRSVASD